MMRVMPAVVLAVWVESVTQTHLKNKLPLKKTKKTITIIPTY